MIAETDESFFDVAARVDAVACPVNCVGKMGAGLALAVARRWPDCVRPYEFACSQGLQPGEVVRAFVTLPTARATRLLVVYHVPTKRHWRDPSDLADVAESIETLADLAERDPVESLYVPALGCGLGGLAWADVRPLLVEAFAPLKVTAWLPR